MAHRVRVVVGHSSSQLPNMWGPPLLSFRSSVPLSSHLTLTSSCIGARQQAGRTRRRQSCPPSRSGSAWVSSERQAHPGHLTASSLLQFAAINDKQKPHWSGDLCLGQVWGSRAISPLPANRPVAQMGTMGKESPVEGPWGPWIAGF